MSINMDNTRERMREMFSMRRSTPRISIDTAHVDHLREIGAYVVLTSPKIYESGLITSLDLRLVDLYGDCAFESRDVTSVDGEDEIGY